MTKSSIDCQPLSLTHLLSPFKKETKDGAVADKTEHGNTKRTIEQTLGLGKEIIIITFFLQPVNTMIELFSQQ